VRPIIFTPVESPRSLIAAHICAGLPFYSALISSICGATDFFYRFTQRALIKFANQRRGILPALWVFFNDRAFRLEAGIMRNHK